MEALVIIVMVLAAVAAVIYPLLRRSGTEPLDPAGSAPPDDDALEREVARYRAALRAGTLCRRCGAAKREGSRYCAECGRRIQREAA
jgi:hypothetical protein